MDRRQFLAASGAGITGATAGCVSNVLGSDETGLRRVPTEPTS